MVIRWDVLTKEPACSLGLAGAMGGWACKPLPSLYVPNKTLRLSNSALRFSTVVWDFPIWATVVSSSVKTMVNLGIRPKTNTLSLCNWVGHGFLKGSYLRTTGQRTMKRVSISACSNCSWEWQIVTRSARYSLCRDYWGLDTVIFLGNLCLGMIMLVLAMNNVFYICFCYSTTRLGCDSKR